MSKNESNRRPKEVIPVQTLRRIPHYHQILSELEQKGDVVSTEAVAHELAARDRRDSTRATAPLMLAPGAVYVDTTHLSIEEVEQVILRIVGDRTRKGADSQQ